jgi:hypothetical protein
MSQRNCLGEAVKGRQHPEARLTSVSSEEIHLIGFTSSATSVGSEEVHLIGFTSEVKKERDVLYTTKRGPEKNAAPKELLT